MTLCAATGHFARGPDIRRIQKPASLTFAPSYTSNHSDQAYAAPHAGAETALWKLQQTANHLHPSAYTLSRVGAIWILRQRQAIRSLHR